MRNQIHNLSYTRTCDASRCPSDIRNLLVESQIRFVTEIRVWLAREPRFILFWTLFHTVAVPTQFFVPANTNDYALLRPEIWRHLEARVPLCDREILHDLVFPLVFHLHLENYTEMLRIICVELRGDLPTEQASGMYSWSAANLKRYENCFDVRARGNWIRMLGWILRNIFHGFTVPRMVYIFSWYQKGCKERRFRNF